MRTLSTYGVVLLALICLECGGRPPGAPGDVPPGGVSPSPSPAPAPGPPAGPRPVLPPPASSPVFVGAGDIAVCGLEAPRATAALLDRISGIVFTLGDNAYESGTREDFRTCYDPTWGRHKGRTRPSPGNHEYGSPGAEPYFEYFGANAGPPGLGYYSFEIGEWLAVSLNSNIAADARSPQASWLRHTLASSRAKCTVAYWHHPVFSSGPHGPTPHVQDLWRILHEFDTDLLLVAHDHLYERFAPQSADGALDPHEGIRQFTVGTGGAALYEFTTVHPNSEVRISTHGVLKLTLGPESFAWEFVGVSGQSDAGVDGCHWSDTPRAIPRDPRRRALF